MSLEQRLLIVGSIVVSITYVLPMTFLLGAAAVTSIWDPVMSVRTKQRGWFIAWVTGLALAVLGAAITFLVLPRLPSI
ncbi:hypothetical protein [Intrasporangium sp. YIM S08009]|uniref:hypothetical protein n=1 Tax=Intrasporangium zincisolvens TaxID=3080018 RepID=UPI002B05383C|nr:hypothetical protein [Intrasporangium sp. YIM S08009]